MRGAPWINAGEQRYGTDDPGGKVFRTVSEGHEIHEYELNGPPYLGFPASFDVHGDGSVVVALAEGHRAGNALRATVARACDSAEAAALNSFSHDQQLRCHEVSQSAP
jgi:hypothetical protein